MLREEAFSQILVRETEDWASLTRSDSRAVCEARLDGWAPLLRNRFLSNLERWDRLLPVSYSEYRAFLTSLASRSWASTGLPVARRLLGLRTAIPTDDDDWFHPEIGAKVRVAFDDPGVDVVCWPCWWYFPSPGHYFWRGATYQEAGWPQCYASNAYAVRAPAPTCVYLRHDVVKTWYIKGCEKREVWLDEPLSVWVGHSASLYTLSRSNLNVHQFGLAADDTPPPGLEWAAGLVAELAEFTRRLQPGCRML